MTSTCLRQEHFDNAKMVFQKGLDCALLDGEASANTACAMELVAKDMVGLTNAVATALTRALSGSLKDGVDTGLLKSWCDFYDQELVPKTRSMLKGLSNKLDKLGVFLSAHMKTTFPLLEKGLKLTPTTTKDAAAEEPQIEAKKEEKKKKKASVVEEPEAPAPAPVAPKKEKAIPAAAEEEEEEEEDEEEALEEEEDEDEGDEEFEYEEEYYDDE
eukprot:CAMPEP_0116847572 /NCGR_PEP_ID=MMETSP0418-20121206/14509_1 /TAXON_ID=1158023 /ORGANISM="Astrosyne radiata, Strain 13vi08-1A" /LENGTH=214 /DNA_ID=CAMNT_0004479033 /DNA_START=309 /DNA_END=953 /DNA_ORIENTATION=-